jgi:hypothetical protein
MRRNTAGFWRRRFPKLSPAEQRGLRQADLVSVLGSRAQVSDLVNGKRGIGKAQAKKLAEYFGNEHKINANQKPSNYLCSFVAKRFSSGDQAR